VTTRILLFDEEVRPMSTHDSLWPDGQECAVSLTDDDGLAVHYEHAGPALVEVARYVRDNQEAQKR
jgi:hypothetical protein